MKSTAPFQFQKSPTRPREVQVTPQQRSIKEINETLDFIGLFNGLQAQNKMNDPLLSANFSLNLNLLSEKTPEQTKRPTNPGPYYSQIIGREIVNKNNSITRFIDLMRVAEDKHKRGYFSARSSQISKITQVSKLVSFYDQESIDDTEILRPFQYSAQKRKDSIPESTPVWRKNSQSPLRETEKKSVLNFSDSPESHLAQSRGLKIDTFKGSPQLTHQTSSGLYNGMDNLNSSRVSTGRSSPYFQYNFRPDARSVSPRNSSTRKMDFINLVESEILNASKVNKTSVLKMQSSTKNMVTSQPNQANQVSSASIRSPTSTLTTSTSWMKTSQQSPGRTKAVIVDAAKRFRMANSPKQDKRLNKNETENLKKSLKILNQMIA